MNQIVHIFRKDCRHLWKVIAAVLVFTAFHGYGNVIQPVGGYAIGRSPYAVLLILVGLSYIVLPVALFLLVVSVIQEESLVGSEKFWLTRPYDRRSLFLEKLLFVVVWVLLPMLLHDVLLIRHFGFSLSSAFGLLLGKNGQFVFFLLIAATFAVLSESFARAVLLAIVAILIAGIISLSVGQDAADQPVIQITAKYMMLAVLALASLGAVCVTTFQYRFRIKSVAVGTGVITILVCALLARFWPSSLTSYLSNRYASPLVTSVQLLPDASLTSVTRPPAEENPNIQARIVYYPFQAVGLPNDVSITVNSSSANFASPGKRQTVFYLAQQARFQPIPASSLFVDSGSPDQLVSFMIAFPNDLAPLKNADGTLSGKLYFEGFRSSVLRVPVPLPFLPQNFVIAGRHCSVEAGQREGKLVLRFGCVELEPGNTSRFQVHLLQDNQEIIPEGTFGETTSQSGWPSFLSPIVRTNFYYEFSRDTSGEILNGAPKQGREVLVFVEQSLGSQERDFRIDHFRPAEVSLQAWEQRGVVRTESTATQSNNGTKPKFQ